MELFPTLFQIRHCIFGSCLDPTISRTKAGVGKKWLGDGLCCHDIKDIEKKWGIKGQFVY